MDAKDLIEQGQTFLKKAHKDDIFNIGSEEDVLSDVDIIALRKWQTGVQRFF